MSRLSRTILNLILPLGVTLNVHAEEFKYETDPFKYIPRGVVVRAFDVNNNGILETYWWDSNYDGEIQEEVELFIDINEDGIIDMSYLDFMRRKSMENLQKIFLGSEFS